MIGIPQAAPPAFDLRSAWSGCLRYWEPRRLFYNLALLVTFLSRVQQCQGWARILSWQTGAELVVLAALANFCYCLAYPLDLALQYSEFRSFWLECRSGLFFAGCLLGGALTFLITTSLVGAL